MELEDWVGAKVNHEYYGDGTVIGVANRGTFNGTLLVEFNKESSALHDGFPARNCIKYGANGGKKNHCLYVYPGELEPIKGEGKK